ncbi:MAG: hypothetical protein ACYDD1_00980 [Caulobacteraceae bacterium]
MNPPPTTVTFAEIAARSKTAPIEAWLNEDVLLTEAIAVIHEITPSAPNIWSIIAALKYLEHKFSVEIPFRVDATRSSGAIYLRRRMERVDHNLSVQGGIYVDGIMFQADQTKVAYEGFADAALSFAGFRLVKGWVFGRPPIGSPGL